MRRSGVGLWGMQAVFVYVTVPTEAEAVEIARAIVNERLAACANILPGMKTIHHWLGKVAEGEEIVLILKTRQELFPKLEERVRELHSYQMPCIAALPVTAASKPFLDWIYVETD